MKWQNPARTRAVNRCSTDAGIRQPLCNPLPVPRIRTPVRRVGNYIGSYLLVEDNIVRSDPQTVFDAQLGYRIGENARLRLDIFNLFNQKTNDISYYYTSRLPGEPPDGVADKHVHPGESRSFRVSLSYQF